MVNNTIKPAMQAPAAQAKGEFTYKANGEDIKLSSSIVRKYLVNGDAANVTDQEVMMFLTLCKYQHLNPFLRECYLVKYGNSPATIVTGKDTFTKRASRNPNYKGKQSGIIVYNPETGAVENREGTFKLPNEQIVGGWARIFIKDREPEYNTVSFDEYAGRKKDGTLNSQWASKPATMIRKVAVVQALRDAFPDDFDAMYSLEEMGEVNEVIPENDNPVILPQEMPAALPEAQPVQQAAPAEPQPEPQPKEAQANDVAAALFG
jgi:phage recombination protein Bet